MPTTLKKKYESRKLVELRQRAAKLDVMIINENRTAQLIIEAINQEDLNKISQIIKKLETIKNAAGDIPALKSGIEQAQTELNNYTNGGLLSKAWETLKKKVGIDNPIVKITTFTSALEQGFKQLPQILKNNGIDLNNLKNLPPNTTLADAVAQQFVKSPDVTASALKNTVKNEADGDGGLFDSSGPSNGKDIDAGADAKNDPKSKQKVSKVIDQIRMALAPSGVFSVFKKIPYVDGKQLANELSNVQLQTLVAISKAVTSGPQTAEIAGDLKQNVVGAGAVQNKQNIPANPTTPPSANSQSEPGTNPTTSGTGAVATGSTTPPTKTAPSEATPGGSDPAKVKAMLAKLITASTHIKNDRNYVKVLAQKLIDAGVDPNKLDIA